LFEKAKGGSKSAKTVGVHKITAKRKEPPFK
jgi:hypothetical protein